MALMGCVTVIDASDGVDEVHTQRNSSVVGLSREAPVLAAGTAQEIGRATLTEGPSGVLIVLQMNAGSLPPGLHGVHLHQAGVCDDPSTGFTAAGAHVGHGENGAHGLLNPNGPEAGDLPSIFAPATGAFTAELFSPFVTLAPHGFGGRAPLADADGSALVIHANRDDQSAQPIGGAGPRIACAAFNAGR